MIRILLSFILIVSLFDMAYGAATGRIIGTITEAESNSPLPGANITIQGTSRGTATDLDGDYILANVPPGNYTLVVTFIGFHREALEVSVAPNRTVRRDFQLQFEALKGEQVTVTVKDKRR